MEEFRHVQKYLGPDEEVRERSQEIINALGTVAKQYAMEPIEIIKAFGEIMEGGEKEREVIGGIAYPKRSRELATDIAFEALGGGMAGRLAAPPPKGSLGIFGGGRAYRDQTRDIESDYSFLSELARQKKKAGDITGARKAEEQAIKAADKVLNSPSALNIQKYFDAVQKSKSIKGEKGNIDIEDAEKIRKETGWFKPEWYTKRMSSDEPPITDSGWRFEIDDREFDLTNMGLDIVSNLRANVDNRVKVNEIVKHEKLFEAYPKLKEYPVTFKRPTDMGGADGMYLPGTHEFYISTEAVKPDIPKIMIHELQHAVQDLEGFSPGTGGRAAQTKVRALQNKQDASRALIRYKSDLENNPQNARDFLQTVKYQYGVSPEWIETNANKYSIPEIEAELKRVTKDLDIVEDDPFYYYKSVLGEQEARDAELRYYLYKEGQKAGKEIDPKEQYPYGMVVVQGELDKNPEIMHYRADSPKDVGRWERVYPKEDRDVNNLPLRSRMRKRYNR